MKMVKSPNSGHGGLTSSSAKVLSIEDLLQEILLRVQPRYLLRLQCVSKQWESILSDPWFLRLHMQKSTSSSSSAIFLVGECTKNPIYISKIENEYQILKTNPLDMEVTLLNRVGPGSFIRHSCNGLICIATPINKVYSADSFWCQVYNPCTHQYATIPGPNNDQVSGYLAGVNLAFDPSESGHFKIIGIWEDMIDFTFFVYSSKTNSWKNAGVSVDARFDRYSYGDYDESLYFFRNGVFLNGKLHSVSNTSPFLCFDTIADRFVPMPSTPVPSKGRNIRYFGSSNRRLHLQHNQSTIFNVLEMREDYSEWYVKNTVDIEFVPRMYPRMMGKYGYLNILSLIWENDEQKIKLLLSVPEQIITCDLEEETVTELFDMQPEHSYYKWYHAYNYFESLYRI